MTTDDFIKKQQAKIEAIIKNDVPLRIAVSSVMTLQSKRIFIEGKNVAGNVIGKYKGGEIYVNPTKPNKWGFKPMGKNQTRRSVSDDKKKLGRERKTKYFENYLAFKKVLGKNNLVTTVDLQLTGALHRNWANGRIELPTARKINQHNFISVLSELNQKKVERYGNVFGISKFEKSEFLRIIQIELKKALA